MKDRNKSDQNVSQDELDRILNYAVAQHAAVEPRPGLEERVLASLRAELSERTQQGKRGWWHWGVAAVVAAVLVIGIALAFRSLQSAPVTVLQRPAPLQIPAKSTESMTVSKNKPGPMRNHEPRRALVHQPSIVLASNPKLEVFPSPQPLSEQEQILQGFIQKYPKDAALIAEARMESLRQDEEERQAELATDNPNSK